MPWQACQIPFCVHAVLLEEQPPPLLPPLCEAFPRYLLRLQVCRLSTGRREVSIPVEEGATPNDHCGQYFLITPKLLPNLEGMENEEITVLFVFSGPYNFDNCLDWNVDKFIADKKRILSQRTEVDNGNSRGKKRRSQ